jgi:hypothetical protein
VRGTAGAVGVGFITGGGVGDGTNWVTGTGDGFGSTTGSGSGVCGRPATGVSTGSGITSGACVDDGTMDAGTSAGCSVCLHPGIIIAMRIQTAIIERSRLNIILLPSTPSISITGAGFKIRQKEKYFQSIIFILSIVKNILCR